MGKIERLDSFLDKEINETESFIMSTRDANYLSACKTKRLLEAIRRDYCDGQKGYCEMEKYLNLSNVKINKPFINFIKKVAAYYAAMPLTETESSTRIPILPTRKYIDNSEIIDFMNELYNNELETKNIIRFNCGNVRIFQNTFLHKKFTKKCVPYHNFHYQYSILLLNKYYDINDLITTSFKALEILPNIEFRTFDNIINIMEYYLKYKAINKVRNEYNIKDANAFNLQALDGIIIEARQVLILLNKREWDDISKYQQSCILNFIDKILGAAIAFKESTSLKDMMDIIGEDGNIFDMDSFNLSPENIYSTAKEVESTLKKYK